jgi:hypothetical protein
LFHLQSVNHITHDFSQCKKFVCVSHHLISSEPYLQ